MRIGMWSDSVGFPNLPLMKLSAYHRSQGDTVEFIQAGGHYDKAYLSKTFNLPAIKKIPQAPPLFVADEVQKGGTGYAIDVVDGKEVFRKDRHVDLPSEIEHLYPDYDLYPEYKNTAYGFLTRGCCNACGFCIVSPKEGRCSTRVADLNEFWRGQKVIKLLDPNILACREREGLLSQLVESKASVDFTQGLDARFITEDVVQFLNRMKVKNIHFAFDFMRNEQAILKGLACFNQNYEKSHWNLNCYVLTNYDTSLEEDWYRVRKITELGFHPDVRIYQKGTQPQFLTDLARWSNNRMIFNSTSFPDYVPRVDGKSCRELYPEILNEKEIFIMATTKKPTETAAVDYSTMNVFQKLQLARVRFLEAGVDKSGKHMKLEYKYFELADIVPKAEQIFLEIGLMMVPSMYGDKATARVYNVNDREDFIDFVAPYTPISPIVSNAGNQVTNEMQATGSSITYIRRYLWQLVLDIVEHDSIDSGEFDTTPTPAPAVAKKPPVTTAQRQEIKKELTGAPAGAATKEQVSTLKSLLKKLMGIDAEQEQFVQTIAMKTEGFSKIEADKCDALIEGVNNMLAGYEMKTAKEG